MSEGAQTASTAARTKPSLVIYEDGVYDARVAEPLDLQNLNY